jgi:hypothetical protein
MLPNEIIAGDTMKVEYEHSDYPVADWTYALILVGPSTVTITGVAGLFTLTAAQSSILKAGQYEYAYRATSGSEQYTLQTGTTRVRPSFALATTRINTAERMIDLIEKALLNQLSEGEAVEALSIGGRSLTTISRMELLKERGFWIAELRQLRNAQSGNSGIRSIRLNVGRL